MEKSVQTVRQQYILVWYTIEESTSLLNQPPYNKILYVYVPDGNYDARLREEKYNYSKITNYFQRLNR